MQAQQVTAVRCPRSAPLIGGSRPKVHARARAAEVKHAVDVSPARDLEVLRGAEQRLGVALCAAVTSATLLFAGASAAAVVQTSAPGSNLGFLTDEEVAAHRKELNFVRAYDGKVALRNRDNDTLWDVKLDLKSPGTLLLRSPKGTVHYLAYSTLQQIDLSDDEVVGAITSTPWEANVTAVEAVDEEQQVQRLELTREGFFELVSVVDP